ncbi:ATP synthase subunit I [Massilia sp. S19_KUP03_FR1]|uniref:ATP synthase subunit I n=1 Tax=Massilia sp. S19_KUP03_FR1 TaxID=3025503 RepID=UPI002FCDCCF7
MMPDLSLLTAAVLAGAILGALFFGGLWWTVQRAAVSPRPALWFGPSLLLRIAVVGGGFYLVNDGSWPTLAACLAGLLLARVAVLRVTARRPGSVHAS